MNFFIKISFIFTLIFLLGCKEKEYVKDFKVEGIAVGDSLLTYFSEEDILKNQRTKDIFGKPDDLTSLYVDSTFEDYEFETYQKILNEIGNYPVISLAPIVNPVIDTVTFDAYLGGYLVAKHFEELGYTNVGIITGPSNKVEALYRKNGFLDYATTSKNLNCVWEYNGDYSVESGYQAYNNLKDRHQSKVAIFGSNDQTCFGFIKKAILDGRKIPDEIAIVGYDDLPFCKLFLPELTSVNTNFYELGKVSIRLLEKKFQGQNDSHGHINLVPVSLSVRTSSQRKR